MRKPVYPRKKINLRKKLTDDDIEVIKESVLRGVPIAPLAERFNVHYTTILYHVSEERKKYVLEMNKILVKNDTNHRKKMNEYSRIFRERRRQEPAYNKFVVDNSKYRNGYRKKYYYEVEKANNQSNTRAN